MAEDPHSRQAPIIRLPTPSHAPSAAHRSRPRSLTQRHQSLRSCGNALARHAGYLENPGRGERHSYRSTACRPLAAGAEEPQASMLLLLQERPRPRCFRCCGSDLGRDAPPAQPSHLPQPSRASALPQKTRDCRCCCGSDLGRDALPAAALAPACRAQARSHNSLPQTPSTPGLSGCR